MKKKIIITIISLSLILCMSLSAVASWNSSSWRNITYKKGYQYYDATYTFKKTNSMPYNRMEGKNKTSWTIPRAAIVEPSTHTAMTGLYPVHNNNVIIAESYATSVNTYTLQIYGSPNQLGSDTMDFRVDLNPTEEEVRGETKG